jgi:antitoxin component YwqK of YwqJK toxin-antitoxin module
MKKIFIASITIFISLTGYAQMSNTADTLKKPDPENKNLVYCEIKNEKGDLHETGNFNTAEEYRNGQINGVKFSFDESGYLSEEAVYKNGILNGRRIAYRYGTMKKEVEHYSNGILDGPKQVFYESGSMQEDGGYKQGKRDGLVKWFNQDGMPSIEYTYKMGVIEGPAKTYYSSGKIQTEENDNETGEWKEYDENGAVSKTVIYDNGKKIKETPAKK